MTDEMPDDPRLAAGVDLIGRTGATTFQLRYSDDEPPTVWLAVGVWEYEQGTYYESAGAMDPARAVVRLCEALLDGVGLCLHCARPVGVSDDWTGTMPLSHYVCWYVFDPETEKFRRSCEGDTDPKRPAIGRNDPCPCGSGLKLKRCHGARSRRPPE